MNRGQARLVAIVVVVAMIVALAAAALTSGGDGGGASDTASDVDRSRTTAAAPAATSEDTPPGPHLQVEVCNGAAGTCPAPDEDQLGSLASMLESDPRVASAEYVTADQAYARFLERYGDDEEFASTVEPGDLPARFNVEVLVLDSMPGLIDDVRQLPGVLNVVDLVALRPGGSR